MSQPADPRAHKIREQLQDYARMRGELSTAQALLSKTAIEWRKERSDWLKLERQRALRRLGAFLERCTHVKMCRLVAHWHGSRSIRRKRFDETDVALGLLMIDPESLEAEEQRSFRRKGLELFQESPVDAVYVSRVVSGLMAGVRSLT